MGSGLKVRIAARITLVVLGALAVALAAGAAYTVKQARDAGRDSRAVLPVARRMIATGLADAYAPEPVDTLHAKAATAMWLRPSQAAAVVWDWWNLHQALGHMRAQYPALRVPVIVLVGEHDDRMTEAVPLVGAVPGAELRVIPDDGHYVNRTRPELVLDAVDAIVARQR